MSSLEEIRELLPAYVLGALDDDDRRRVNDHLAAAEGSEEGALIDADLLALTAQLEVLAGEVEPVRAAVTTRARVLRRVAASTTGPPAPARREWMPWAAAAALFLVAVTLGWQNFTLRRVVANLAAGRDRVEIELATLRSEFERTRADSARLAAAQRIVAAPNAARVLLAGLEDAPAASGSTHVDARTGRAVFYAADLPPLAAERTYQLWFVGGEGPVSGGTFEVDERGEASLVVENVLPPDQIAAWAVTVEPAGGVPQPTGVMVLKG